MITIVYLSDGRATQVTDPDMTILDVSIAQTNPHLRERGGNGRCTTCRVRIGEGIQNVSPRSPREIEVADALRWDSFTRLACQTRVIGDVTLERLIKSGADVSRVQSEGASVIPAEEKTLAVLFCDIREFTPFADKTLCLRCGAHSRPLLQRSRRRDLFNNGMIFQYVGDQIIGLVGVGGDPGEKSCRDTLRAGLGLLEALNDLNRELSAEFGSLTSASACRRNPTRRCVDRIRRPVPVVPTSARFSGRSEERHATTSASGVSIGSPGWLCAAAGAGRNVGRERCRTTKSRFHSLES